MQDADRQLLVDAIARNNGVVLSLPSAGMLRHHKSRFLADAEDGFWIESAPAEASLIDELITSRQPCGISFKSGPTKVVFGSPVCARQTEYRVNAETIVEALLMLYPDTIKAVQRRNTYRVSVPADAEVTVKVWRMPPRAFLHDRPMAAQAIATSVRDLSVGGMGVTFAGEGKEFPKVSVDDRLRIEIAHNGESFLVEGFMKHPVGKITTPTVRAGIQFKDLGTQIEGRQTISQLTRIVGELQRAEARRYRLGITKVA
jgi:c-di-GMP-binding flagellar brake protein YcgR